jgi:branched-chain amino acid transport system substrate-binding protein
MSRWFPRLVLATAISLFCGIIKTAHAADDIVIGEYGSMTGAEATFGISTDNGVKLAVNQRNAAGGINGRQIKLIAYDDQGKQQEVITAVTRLIQQDHVSAVIGEVASSLSLAGGQVAQRMGVPMITPSSTNARVTTIGDMISRVCFIDSFQGYVGASFAKNKLGFTKAAILYDRSQAYSSGLRNDFKKAFDKIGGTVAAEEAYSGGDSDYSAQLTSIKNADPQFIYLPGYYTEVVNIARQARKLGITVPFIGGDGWVSDDLKNAGDALDGCFFSDHYAKEDDQPQVRAFLDQFKAAYNRDPDSMAALGFDAANLLFDAMTRAKSLDGQDLANAINSTKDFNGVTGKITIDKNRNAQKSAVIQKLQGGLYSFFARVQPPG